MTTMAGFSTIRSLGISRGVLMAAALGVAGLPDLTSVAGGVAAGPSPCGIATVAPFKKAPVVDGKIEPGEWGGAVGTVGFAAAPMSGHLLARTGTTRIGFHNDRIYIAIVSDYPPTGKDHSSGVNRDKDYVGDESVEIWLDPNRANRESGTGDQRFYQMNANAAGGIYDISFDAKKGPDTGWNGDWEYACHLDHVTHKWTAEISLPFADMGWTPGTAVGKTIGVLISRNFKSPWEQATSFPVVGAFVDWSRYAAIHLTQDAPSVAIEALGDKLHKGLLQMRATITNPGTARKAKVSLLLKSSDMPEILNEKEVDLPAGGSVPYVFNDSEGRLHEDAKHSLLFDVTAEGVAVPVLHYTATWTKAPEKIWGYHIGPNPDAALQFAYYPSFKFVRVKVDARELDPKLGETCKKADVVIARVGGAAVVKDTITWDKAPGRKEVAVGDLADGEYTLTVTVEGWKEPLVRTFTRKHFPFEGNKLGIIDEVLPPFTPIKVKGKTVSVVHRDYEVGGLGLWSSIKAAGNVSAGGPAELLAGPMTLKVKSEALDVKRETEEVLTGKGKFTTRKDNSVVYEGVAKHPAVTVASRCTTEYDGCMKVELTLMPPDASAKNKQPVPLNSLVLEIPLQDKMMPLWHVSTTGLRINPAGATPAGNGAIWDSSKFPDGNWFGNFKCYLWLGDAERGLCWFADNDAGWGLSLDAKGQPNKPCQELIRKEGVLTLRVNLVQAPMTLTEPRKIVFGVMATPAKPMASDWRQRGTTLTSAFNMGYACPATFCAKMPWGGDFSIADWCYNRRVGKPGPTAAEVADWKKRNFPADMEPKFRDGMINLALGPFLNNFNPRQAYFKMYFDEFHTTSAAHPESQVYQSEWSGGWYQKLIDHPTQEGHKSFGLSVANIVDSHADFACWYAAEWIKRGIGCYFDNAFPMQGRDLLTTTAYRLPNGSIQASAGMWARREYLKRIWVLHRLLGPKDAKPAMMIHMTNTHIVPYMVWNDENLDLEWKDAAELAQTKYGPDFLRAESLGRQSGNVPFAIAHIMGAKTPELEAAARRTRFGVLMTHEIRTSWSYEHALIKNLVAFGYGEETCRVINYWDAQPPVKADDPDCKWLLLENKGELLMLVCTWNTAARTVKFEFDPAKLAGKPTQAVNDEKPTESYVFNGRTLTLDVPAYGVMLVRMK